MVPGEVEPDLYNEHLVRYLFSQQFTAGKTVLDLGCGVGYGSSLTARIAAKVISVDVSFEAVTYARENFSSAKLHYLVTDATLLSLASNCIDVVLCFEVIEHLIRQESLLEEARRVLKPEGIVVVSTPNRVFYTEERRLANPYHTREFSFGEFRELLERYFPQVELVYQNHISSIFVGEAGRPLNVNSCLEDDAVKMQETSNFFVAVCGKTAQPLPPYESLVYLNSTGNLLRDKEQRIERLEGKLIDLDHKILQLQSEFGQRTAWCLQLEEVLKEREAALQKLQKEYDETVSSLQQALSELQKEFQERTSWAQRLSQENSDKDQRISQMQCEYDERTDWALRLDNELKKTQEQLNRVKQSKLYRLSKALHLVPKIS